MTYRMPKVNGYPLDLSVGDDACEPPEFLRASVGDSVSSRTTWLDRKGTVLLRDTLTRILDENPE